MTKVVRPDSKGRITLGGFAKGNNSVMFVDSHLIAAYTAKGRLKSKGKFSQCKDAYAENKTPLAYRIFWMYGPSKKEITIIAIPHP